MNRAPQESRRRLIPRWRSYSRTVRAGELAAPPARKPQPEPDTGDLEVKAVAFAQQPNTVNAAELLAAGSVFADPDAAKGAIATIMSAADVAPAVRFLAARLAAPAVPAADVDPRDAVRRMRTQLRGYERNPHLWADLARAYVVQGQNEPATRAMRVALALAPNDRFVLRAASRLYVQIGRPDRAHALLVKTEATPHDPWLLAAEIASADLAGKTTRLVHNARHLIGSAHHSERDLTELTGSLATLELDGGNRKAASKLYRRSLIDPTANALAQAAWARTDLTGLDIKEPLSRAREGWEAKALQYCEFGAWKDAIDECREWLADEPFSFRAALGGNFAAEMAGNHQLAEAFARDGLSCNPTSGTMRNNLVVALAGGGRVAEALDQFKLIVPGSLPRGTHMATGGLVAFRAGNLDLGRKFYRAAVDWLQANNPNMVGRALAYLAREEILAGTESPEAILREVHTRSKTMTAPERLVIDAVLAPALPLISAEVRPPRPKPKIILPDFLRDRFPMIS